MEDQFQYTAHTSFSYMLKPFLSYLTMIYITLDICYISKQLSWVPKEYKVVIFFL